jgi:hypothetical protein
LRTIRALPQLLAGLGDEALAVVGEDAHIKGVLVAERLVNAAVYVDGSVGARPAERGPGMLAIPV